MKKIEGRVYRKSKEDNRKTTLFAIILSLIFGTLVGLLGTVVAPPSLPYNIFGTANEGVSPPGVGVADGSEISAWIDGVCYGTTTTTAGGSFNLNIVSDFWGDPITDGVKDGGYDGDTNLYFLDYNPMGYFLNASHTTSSHQAGSTDNVGIMFFNRTDLAPGLTTLRLLKINEIVLDPEDGMPQYVIIYDPGQHLGMNNITDYYLQKDNNITHTPDGETFDFLTHATDIIDMSNGYYYINLTSDLGLNDSDELKLIWKSPYIPNVDPALTGPGNGTDIVVDRVEWGNYTNYINPITPPDDRDYDNTTLLDFIDVSGLYGTGASMIRTDDKFFSSYSGNGTDTDDCYADFKVLGTATQRPQPRSDHVHNIDTDEYFDSIQAAIDDSDTLDGHTIEVSPRTFYENVVVNKTINLTGENRDTTVINGGGSGIVVNITADWVNLTGFNITNAGGSDISAGLILYNVSHCRITNNIIFSNSNFGIYLSYSSNINITGNNVSDNYYGILLGGSSTISITNNNFINDGIFIAGDVSHCNSHYIPANNFVNGKPLKYYKDSNGIDIDGMSLGQLILANCTNMNVKNLHIDGTDTGIEVAHCSNSFITGNNLTNNIVGIYHFSSSNNNIIKNNLSDNDFGLVIVNSSKHDIIGNYISKSYGGLLLHSSSNNNVTYNTITSNLIDGIQILYSSNNNTFHHNNIGGNLNHVKLDNSTCFDNKWDDGDGEGNYWSDYSGLDDGSGGRTVGDGVGDTEIPHPFEDKGNGYYQLDNYPLMAPFGNYILLYEGWNLISIPSILSETNQSTVLSSITGAYDTVWWYNVSDALDHWKLNNTSKPPYMNDLDCINHTMGFWIRITKPGGVLFEYPGTQPTENQTIQLYPGWNMVGYPSLSSKNRTTALNNLTFGSHVDAIWTFNAAIQKWEEVEEADLLFPGRGYWIHAITKCEWEVPL